RRLALSGASAKGRHRRPAQGRQVALEQGTRVEAHCVAATTGRFAVGLASGEAVMLNAAGRQSWRTSAHTGPVTALAFDQAGQLLSAGEDGLVHRMDERGQSEEQFAAGLPLSALAVSPEGKQAAVVRGKKVILFGPGAGGTHEITSLCPFSACFAGPDTLVV